MMPLPDYYSSLGPFREIFSRGRPILTYHHVGPRPPGVRIKGLYVPPKLFARQIAELSRAGFSAPPYGAVTAPFSSEGRNVFITFDDGFVDVLQNALPVLQQHAFSSILFLVSGLLGKTNEWQQRAGDVTQSIMDETQVRDWLAAGQDIGAHTQTHPRLTRLSLPAAREEIQASKKSLEDRFGRGIEHFCYPYGDWNEKIRDLVSEAGYRTACTTMAGINTSASSPFELKRFTARYPSRKLTSIWRSLRYLLRM